MKTKKITDAFPAESFKGESLKPQSLKTVSFKSKVLDVVKSIAPGDTLSYKQVAARAGNPNAARAVGYYMSKNRDPLVPCHRVIGSDGKLHGFAWGLEKKQEMLDFERRTQMSYNEKASLKNVLL